MVGNHSKLEAHSSEIAPVPAGRDETRRPARHRRPAATAPPAGLVPTWDGAALFYRQRRSLPTTSARFEHLRKGTSYLELRGAKVRSWEREVQKGYRPGPGGSHHTAAKTWERGPSPVGSPRYQLPLAPPCACPCTRYQVMHCAHCTLNATTTTTGRTHTTPSRLSSHLSTLSPSRRLSRPKPKTAVSPCAQPSRSSAPRSPPSALSSPFPHSLLVSALRIYEQALPLLVCAANGCLPVSPGRGLPGRLLDFASSYADGPRTSYDASTHSLLCLIDP